MVAAGSAATTREAACPLGRSRRAANHATDTRRTSKNADGGMHATPCSIVRYLRVETEGAAGDGVDATLPSCGGDTTHRAEVRAPPRTRTHLHSAQSRCMTGPLAAVVSFKYLRRRTRAVAQVELRGRGTLLPFILALPTHPPTRTRTYSHWSRRFWPALRTPIPITRPRTPGTHFSGTTMSLVSAIMKKPPCGATGRMPAIGTAERVRYWTEADGHPHPFHRSGLGITEGRPQSSLRTRDGGWGTQRCIEDPSPRALRSLSARPYHESPSPDARSRARTRRRQAVHEQAALAVVLRAQPRVVRREALVLGLGLRRWRANGRGGGTRHPPPRSRLVTAPPPVGNSAPAPAPWPPPSATASTRRTGPTGS